jgi:hypothetical protein
MLRRQVLVPLAVVALALALWLWPGDDGPVLDVSSDVEACSQNLRTIYAGLIEYEQRFGHAPEGSGIAFLAELIASGVWADTPENHARLTCPGPGAQPVRADVRYGESAALSAADSAYAARDMARSPLAKFPSGGAELEPLVACDNARALNHDGCMNLLRSDGSVVVLELARLIERGELPAGTRTIVVGPASPLSELTKLAGE